MASPLLQIPADSPRRLVLALDGLRYAVNGAELGHYRLMQALQALMAHPEPEHWPKRRTMMLAATVDAWTIIDFVYRLRGFVSILPRMKQKVEELSSFKQRTNRAKELRHFVQHMSEKLPALETAGLPLWGSISWRASDSVEGKQSGFTMVAGTFYRDASVPGPLFGVANAHAVGLVTLSAGGHTADLDDLVRACGDLRRYVEGFYGPLFAGKERLQSDVMMTVRDAEVKGFAKGPPRIPTRFTMKEGSAPEVRPRGK